MNRLDDRGSKPYKKRDPKPEKQTPEQEPPTDDSPEKDPSSNEPPLRAPTDPSTAAQERMRL